MTAGPHSDSDAADAITRNIDTIVRLEQSAQRRRTWADRLSDSIAGFTGTIWFVVLHLVWFGIWAAINAGLVQIVPAFDPYPFQLLCMIVSMESVLISTFVLIKQNRMGYLSDRRAHLDLQINLLAEREVTRILQLCEQMAARLQVDHSESRSPLARETELEPLAEALDQKLAEEK